MNDQCRERNQHCYGKNFTVFLGDSEGQCSIEHQRQTVHWHNADGDSLTQYIAKPGCIVTKTCTFDYQDNQFDRNEDKTNDKRQSLVPLNRFGREKRLK